MRSENKKYCQKAYVHRSMGLNLNDMIRPHFVLYYPLNQALFSTTVEPVLQNRVADLPVAAAVLRGIEYESSELQYSNLLFTLFQDVLLEILFWCIVCILPEAVLSKIFHHYSGQQAFTPRQFEVFSYNLANPSPAEVLADFKRINGISPTDYKKFNLFHIVEEMSSEQ